VYLLQGGVGSAIQKREKKKKQKVGMDTGKALVAGRKREGSVVIGRV